MNNITPYSSPHYFIYLLLLLLPIMIGLWFGKRLHIYDFFATVVILWITFFGGNMSQGISLIFYILYEMLLVFIYLSYRKKHNNFWIFTMFVVLAIVPLVFVKLDPLLKNATISLFGFMGISYLTFKAVEIIMEIRDGAIKNIKPYEFVRFLLFFPTISSGPIDRFRRFQKDVLKVPSRDEYVELLHSGVNKLMQGLAYKFIIGYFFGTLLLPKIQILTLSYRGETPLGISWALVAYMYVYSMYLFFDFAGYSLFAVSISNFMGIKTPMNFKAPFKSKNIKDFWNRWHITLSFWFRDFIYMRLMFTMIKHKWIKNRVNIANFGYLTLFLIMGFWHGETWYYIVYGLFHAGAMITNDAWLRFKKRHRKSIPSNKLTHAFAVFLTFNVVCFSFMIFSGILDKLWF
ncbi:D-alanyl-lipoteichoic acid biosynthesis protein DltB [Companilactobacillus pabuli]|jgi:D-alanyl-lipoteichoic acid biosynthesis protein DltB|uniref:Teichoic acid D-alanyltransferase n=1 Tax=Companilactobacillus pabuli TaxID=2714036 RepID=A0A7L7L0E7_9LACO|nr:D-alanyl-lipoteichoic acid biosynthesis protein DltB [Companilactobacillus pabuli]AKP02555.1 alanine transporter [Companilactobacillus farciminis]AKS50853.1 alanine transporter [Companilactobacillus farciminis]MDG5113981.1 D-alanyl-lipoteichoic acid biosynthesis protein DltB [Companilactobacillus pabuli]QMT84734.1 D-alanyl-lipoteichoic acid biosynthesis protein DltB [Companilactobacillus pabuli]